jgi:hypothetical protein
MSGIYFCDSARIKLTFEYWLVVDRKLTLAGSTKKAILQHYAIVTKQKMFYPVYIKCLYTKQTPERSFQAFELNNFFL